MSAYMEREKQKQLMHAKYHSIAILNMQTKQFHLGFGYRYFVYIFT